MIPNLLSLSRLVLAAAFVYSVDHPVTAIAILCAAGISDWADGFVAKKLGQQSAFGVLLDPICDRIFLVTVLATLVLSKDLPLWQLGVLVSRDIASTAGAALLFWLRPDLVERLRPQRSGKLVTSLQFWCVVHILLGLPFFLVALAAVALATVWAVFDYFGQARALGAWKSVNTP